MKRNRLSMPILAVSFTILFVLFPTAHSQGALPQDPDPSHVYFYEHTNYGGARLVLGEGPCDNLTNWHPYSGKTWNDMISSIKVGKNMKVHLYKDINRKGYIGFYSGNQSAIVFVSSLHQSGNGDKISSFYILPAPSIDPGPNEVYIYENTNYQGEMRVYEVNDEQPNLTQNLFPWGTGKGWNDTISSMKVGRNAKVYIYKDINKQNYLTAYWGNGYDVKFIPNLHTYGYGDVISSFWVVRSSEAH